MRLETLLVFLCIFYKGVFPDHQYHIVLLCCSVCIPPNLNVSLSPSKVLNNITPASPLTFLFTCSYLLVHLLVELMSELERNYIYMIHNLQIPNILIQLFCAEYDYDSGRRIRRPDLYYLFKQCMSLSFKICLGLVDHSHHTFLETRQNKRNKIRLRLSEGGKIKSHFNLSKL